MSVCDFQHHLELIVVLCLALILSEFLSPLSPEEQTCFYLSRGGFEIVSIPDISEANLLALHILLNNVILIPKHQLRIYCISQIEEFY